MGAELARGQNHPLPHHRTHIHVTAAVPVVAGATLGDAHGRIDDAAADRRIAHPGAPALPGIEVPRQPAQEHRLSVDLDSLPRDVHRISVLLTLPPGEAGRRTPHRFGVLPPPRVRMTADDGCEVVAFTLTGLDTETAVIALELYRRNGMWKVRAVGQGYAGGLGRLLADQGLPDGPRIAAEVDEAVTRSQAATDAPGEAALRYGAGHRHPRRDASRPAVPAPRSPETPGPAAAPEDRPDPAEPIAGDAAGWSMEERLYNQVMGMFEDLTRSIAAYRGAVDFAESRLERELDQVLSDPATRCGPAAEAARDQARAKRDTLVDQARACLDHDLRQLTAESEVVEAALPPPYAGWESPAWHGYRTPAETPLAVRLGDLHLPEVPELRIPMLVRLPLRRGLWVDSGSDTGASSTADPGELRQRALDVALALTVRLLAAHPAGDVTVHLVDPAGTAAAAFAPLARAGLLRHADRAAAGADGVAEALSAMTHRVDLVQMALQAQAAESLPADLDPGPRLLVVHGFPYGFDAQAVTQLRYLADEGPSAGVHLMMVADRADARAFGPVLDPLWRSLLRLTPLPDDHLADHWVGHAWTYEPLLPPEGSRVLDRVIGEVAAAGQTHGR